MEKKCLRIGSAVARYRWNPAQHFVGEAGLGPSTSALGQGDTDCGEGSCLPPFAVIILGDFPLVQSYNETLRHAFNQLKVISGHKIQSNVVCSHPYFSINKDRHSFTITSHESES